MGLDAFLREGGAQLLAFSVLWALYRRWCLLGHSVSNPSVSYAADFLFLTVEFQGSLLVCHSRVRSMLSAVCKLRFLSCLTILSSGLFEDLLPLRDHVVLLGTGLES